MIYLDHAASTPLHPKAIEALGRSFVEDFANPSSASALGVSLNKKIESARQFFLSSLKASLQGQFIFTSSATESNNMLIQGLDLAPGDEVLYCPGDHPSVVEPLKILETQGLLLKEIPRQKEGGAIAQNLLPQIVGQKTRLAVLTHVHNVSGLRLDLKSLSRLLRELNPDIHIHVDGSQSFGKIPLMVNWGPLDSVALSAHKMGGPKGVAGLYLKPGLCPKPLLYGGGQEKGLRPSTLNAPLIISWHQGTQALFQESPPPHGLVHLADLKKKVMEILTELIPTVRFPFGPQLGDKEDLGTYPGILSLIIPGLSSDILLRHLEEKEIYVSSSSACSSKIKGERPSLTALGIAPKFHKNLLRVSFCPQTTHQEVEKFAETLGQVYRGLEFLIENK